MIGLAGCIISHEAVTRGRAAWLGDIEAPSRATGRLGRARTQAQWVELCSIVSFIDDRGRSIEPIAETVVMTTTIVVWTREIVFHRHVFYFSA